MDYVVDGRNKTAGAVLSLSGRRAGRPASALACVMSLEATQMPTVSSLI